jgi:hypothetical protein
LIHRAAAHAASRVAKRFFRVPHWLSSPFGDTKKPADLSPARTGRIMIEARIFMLDSSSECLVGWIRPADLATVVASL